MKALVERTEQVGVRDVMELQLQDELAELGVVISKTPQRLGGYRRWFICPEADCGRRCSVLFAVADGLACRVCANLAYQSQRMRPRARMLHRADRIFRQLHVDTPQHPYVDGPKPKAMSWLKYQRLYQLAYRLEERALLQFSMPRLGRRR